MTAEEVNHNSCFLSAAFSDNMYLSISEKMIAYAIYCYRKKYSKFEQVLEQEKYLFAMEMMLENGFSFPPDLEVNPDQIYDFLKDQNDKYAQISYQNKSNCENYVNYVEEQFLEYAPTENAPEIQLEYIFDFICSYIKNMDGGVSWIKKIPPIDNISMDPCCQMPIADPYKETIVFRSGDSFQLSRLFLRLAFQLNSNLRVELLNADFLNSTHYFNSYITDSGTSLIDISGHFRGVQKSNCFLVSGEKLNKNRKYDFPIYADCYSDCSITLDYPGKEQIHPNVKTAIAAIDNVYNEIYGKQFAYPNPEKKPFVKTKATLKCK